MQVEIRVFLTPLIGSKEWFMFTVNKIFIKYKIFYMVVVSI